MEKPLQPSSLSRRMEALLSRILSCLPSISFCFMTYSAFTAIRDTKGDPETVAFVATSFSLVLLLFVSKWELDRTHHVASPSKTLLLKALIWSLSVALTVVFSRRVATILDSTALSVFVWSLAALTAASGFYLLFVL